MRRANERSFDAVLFDWCGTLVEYPTKEDRYRPILRRLGRPYDDGAVAELAAAFREAEQHPDAVESDKHCDLSNGRVEGIAANKSKHLSDWQQAALNFTSPAVPCRTRVIECINEQGDSDELVVVDIETSDRVHSNRKDEVFLRVGDETRQLTFAQRQELCTTRDNRPMKAPSSAELPAVI